MINFFRKIGVKYAMNIINSNPKISRIAEVLELKLEQGKMNLKARLKGETDAINISADYAIRDNAICISGVRASKEWAECLADIFKEKYSKIDLNVISKNALAVEIFKHLF
jgi:hypothetical protein